MSLEDTATKKKKIINIVIIVIMLVASLLVLYFGILTKDSTPTMEQFNIDENLNGDASDKTEDPSLGAVQAGLEQLLNSLKKFGNWPLQLDTEEFGKSNPFLPSF